MRTSLPTKQEAFGKLISTPMVAGIGVTNTSNRLCVFDRETGQRFLIDTGAEISVLAAGNKPKGPVSNAYQLFAANNSPISTYGEKSLVLNLGLRRQFRWSFIIADVKTSILGADFLGHFKLLVDIHRKKLVDRITDLSINAIEIKSDQDAVHMISRSNEYREILKQYPNVLRPLSLKEPAKHNVVHHIETSCQPIHAKARPLPPDKYKLAKQEFEIMMEKGICQPSKSPWASPLHIVKKKDGSMRICGDYRRLNTATLPDRYPIPRIQDFTYQLHNKKVFSKLDLKSAYYWIPMANPEKTAIITPFGLFEFRVMPFGLRNAGQTFQRFMHEVLRGIDGCFPYVDDILLYSEDEEAHKKCLHQVLERLNEHGVALNIEKCEFGKSKINFLGYQVTSEGIAPPADRIETISNYQKPANVQELRRFLGMINFYRDCLPHQAKAQQQLNKYLHNTKKNDKTPIIWSSEAEQAFDHCRQSISKAITLAHPINNTPLRIMTDASDHSLGAVVEQRVQNNAWKPLAFYSKAMSDTQRRYSTYDRELLAIYAAIKHFRRLIEGSDVTVFTDHKPLTYALSKPPTNNDTPRRERQLNFISQFCSNIQYLQGKKNAVADWLSRIDEIYCPSTIDFNELAKDQEKSEEFKQLQKQTNLTFARVTIQGSKNTISCEISTGTPRPYLPQSYRYEVFKIQHELCHSGIRTMRKQTASKYFWPGMNKDIGQWTRACIACQKAKIHRHTITPIGNFPASGRFEHVHIDIVGPLPPCNDYRYIVTMIDRYTKWPEAVPAREITAETVTRIFYENWISRFGCPIRLTTDQGRQFEASIFEGLLKKLGIERIRTTPYHPQANGQVERLHRTLKTALIARSKTIQWAEELPTILLGIRTALRSDNNLSPCLLTYGSQLRIPSDFFLPSQQKNNDAEYVRQLTETMATLIPKQRNRPPQQTFVHKDLATCTHVFVRNDTLRPALTPPYNGPFEVLKRHEKYFKIQLPTRATVISLDRLKPAYILNEEVGNENYPHVNNKAQGSNTYTTRSGRISKPTVRYAL